MSVDFSPQRRKYRTAGFHIVRPTSRAAAAIDESLITITNPNSNKSPTTARPAQKPGSFQNKQETGVSKLLNTITVTSRALQPREEARAKQSGHRAAAAAALAAAAAATAAAAAAAVSANRRPQSAPVNSRLALISTAWSARPSTKAVVPEVSAYVPTGLESLAQAAVSLAIAVKSLASRSRTEDPLVEQVGLLYVLMLQAGCDRLANCGLV